MHGHASNHGRSHRRERDWRVASKSGPEVERERWERSNLEMIVAVQSRKDDHDAKMD